MQTNEAENFEKLYNQGFLKIIGFEANKDQFLKLKNTENKKYLNYCLGDGSERTLFITRYPGCSSLYEPNPIIINLFNSIGTEENGNFAVIEERKVKTIKLDEVKEIGKVDFMKIDTQGSELDILKGFKNKLTDILIIESEVEFLELYKNQPMFSDINNFLYDNNFILHKFIDIIGRPFRPWIVNNNPAFPMSQVLSADAIFLKDFSKPELYSDIDLLKTSLILHEVYYSYDLCFFFLQQYDKRNNLTISKTYKDYIYKEEKINLKFMNLRMNIDKIN